MNEKIKNFFLYYLIVIPIGWLFWLLVFIFRSVWRLQICYYQLSGIKYKMIQGDFGDYPIRLKK